jgi:hypothetical protein
MVKVNWDIVNNIAKTLIKLDIILHILDLIKSFKKCLQLSNMSDP